MTIANVSLRALIAAGTAVTTMTAQTVLAEEQSQTIQEVIVTAQKRQESLQTTPIAISAFTADALKVRGITDFSGVAAYSPSISLSKYPTQSTELILYMRGQGFSDPGQITADGSIGLYEDGFYIARPQFITFDLADLERVEVLRGPQGTLYGRNTTGGAVNIISKKPAGEFKLKEDVDFGNLNYFRSLTSVDLPEWNGFATKVTFVDSHRNGYVKNIGPSNDYDSTRQRGGRFAVHWGDEGPFQVDYFWEIAHADTTPIYWQTPALTGKVLGFYGDPSAPPYHATNSPPSHTWRAIDLPLSHNRFDQNGLTLTWNISDALTIKSLTGYRHSSNDPFTDIAEGYSNPAAGGTTVSFVVFDHYTDHQFSQEFQFVGDLLNHHLRYVAGLYYFKEGGGHFENVGISVKNSLVPPPNGDFYEETDLRYVRAYEKSQAAFAQVTWTPPVLDDKLSLTFGGRYTKDDKSAYRNLIVNVAVPSGVPALNDLGASNVQHSSKFNPAFTAAYDWNEDVNTYLRVATGYKAGGSTESASPGAFGQTYGPEKITSYELGIKSYEFDRHLRLNLALFESKFKDMQLLFQNNPANLAYGLALNAGSATVKGAELDVLFAPIQDLSFTASYTYLHSTIDEVIAKSNTLLDPAVNPLSPYHVGENVSQLFTLPYAPNNSFNVGTDYTFLHLTGSDLSAHLNYRWQDRVYETSPAGPAVPGRNLYSLDPRGIVDARLTWAFELKDNSKLRVSAWSKNLFDKKYEEYTNGQGGVFLAVPGSPAGWSYQTQVWAEPRTFGLNVVFEY